MNSIGHGQLASDDPTHHANARRRERVQTGLVNPGAAGAPTSQEALPPSHDAPRLARRRSDHWPVGKQDKQGGLRRRSTAAVIGRAHTKAPLPSLPAGQAPRPAAAATRRASEREQPEGMGAGAASLGQTSGTSGGASLGFAETHVERPKTPPAPEPAESAQPAAASARPSESPGPPPPDWRLRVAAALSAFRHTLGRCGANLAWGYVAAAPAGYILGLPLLAYYTGFSIATKLALAVGALIGLGVTMQLALWATSAFERAFSGPPPAPSPAAKAALAREVQTALADGGNLPTEALAPGAASLLDLWREASEQAFAAEPLAGKQESDWREIVALERAGLIDKGFSARTFLPGAPHAHGKPSPITSPITRPNGIAVFDGICYNAIGQAHSQLGGFTLVGSVLDNLGILTLNQQGQPHTHEYMVGLFAGSAFNHFVTKALSRSYLLGAEAGFTHASKRFGLHVNVSRFFTNTDRKLAKDAQHSEQHAKPGELALVQSGVSTAYNFGVQLGPANIMLRYDVSRPGRREWFAPATGKKSHWLQHARVASETATLSLPAMRESGSRLVEERSRMTGRLVGIGQVGFRGTNGALMFGYQRVVFDHIELVVTPGYEGHGPTASATPAASASSGSATPDLPSRATVHMRVSQQRAARGLVSFSSGIGAEAGGGPFDDFTLDVTVALIGDGVKEAQDALNELLLCMQRAQDDWAVTSLRSQELVHAVARLVAATEPSGDVDCIERTGRQTEKTLGLSVGVLFSDYWKTKERAIDGFAWAATANRSHGVMEENSYAVTGAPAAAPQGAGAAHANNPTSYSQALGRAREHGLFGAHSAITQTSLWAHRQLTSWAYGPKGSYKHNLFAHVRLTDSTATMAFESFWEMSRADSNEYQRRVLTPINEAFNTQFVPPATGGWRVARSIRLTRQWVLASAADEQLAGDGDGEDEQTWTQAGLKNVWDARSILADAMRLRADTDVQKQAAKNLQQELQTTLNRCGHQALKQFAQASRARTDADLALLMRGRSARSLGKRREGSDPKMPLPHAGLAAWQVTSTSSTLEAARAASEPLGFDAAAQMAWQEPLCRRLARAEQVVALAEAREVNLAEQAGRAA